MIQDLIDGHLSGEEERLLVERISGDPELIDLLVSYTGLDIAITKSLRFSPSTLPDLHQVMGTEAEIAAIRQDGGRRRGCVGGIDARVADGPFSGGASPRCAAWLSRYDL